ncbi:MAG: cytochrome c biogenesis CcdA family protein [Brevinematia bacterium]
MNILISLFDSFTKFFQSNPFIAVLSAFLWGVLSVVLSPCHLSSIPLVIGYINGSGKLKTRRAFFLSLVFSLGILITIAIIGIITGLLGRMLGDIGRIGNIIVAITFILVGIWLMDLISIPQFKALSPDMKGKGTIGAFVLGLIFGLALGPCTFGFMMPLLLVVFQAAQKSFIYSVLLLSAFATGHVAVIVLAGTFVNWVQNYLNWTEKSKGTMILRKACGLLVIATGVYLLVYALKVK